MASKSTRQPNRRETVEAMRREQQRKERRKTLLVVGIAALLGIGLITAAAVPAFLRAQNDPADQEIASFGVAAGQAGCDDVISDEETGQGVHEPQGTVIDYPTAPPASGPHYDEWAPFSRKFYERGDRAELGNLVHNLEHGYTIVWYDETIEGEPLEALEGLATRMAEEAETGGKFIVAPWGEDDTEVAFPEGKHVAISHWTRGEGQRQYCEQVSGEAIAAFVADHPYTDAPEPNAG